MNFDGWLLFEISLAGLGTGGLYALTALAFVMIYKATKVVNIAIGEMLMIGAYLFLAFTSTLMLPIWLAIPLSLLASALIGGLIERTLIRPMLGESPISSFMVTVGLSSILIGLVELIWTADQQRLPEFFPSKPILIGEAFVSPKIFYGFGIALLFIAVVLVTFRYWRGGVALRATASDQAAAYSVGINVPKVFSLAWMLAGAIAGVAGIVVGLYFIGVIYYLTKNAVIPLTSTGQWRTFIDVVAVLSYLVSGLPLIWIALQELGVVNRQLTQEAKLKVHAVCVALFLVFGHVAMIAGMTDPGLFGYEGASHGHAQTQDAQAHAAQDRWGIAVRQRPCHRRHEGDHQRPHRHEHAGFDRRPAQLPLKEKRQGHKRQTLRGKRTERGEYRQTEQGAAHQVHRQHGGRMPPLAAQQPKAAAQHQRQRSGHHHRAFLLGHRAQGEDQ